MADYRADIVVIGGGIAGITVALECLNGGKSVLLIDRDQQEHFGGLAKESFGGMFFVDSPEQRKGGIADSPEKAWADWQSFGQFEENDHWPRAWAKRMVERSTPDVRDWLVARGVSFLPVVQWVERGEDVQGNSLPRFHITWGTGHGLIVALTHALDTHPAHDKLTRLFGHKVERLESDGGQIVGCSGSIGGTHDSFRALGEVTVIAAGGINGSMERVRTNWHPDWGEKPPEVILNGSHKFADGTLHDAAMEIGGRVTNLNRMWNYAAGVRHPRPRKPNHGLSLVPSKSALWLDATGRRFKDPRPLVSAFDTRDLITQICTREQKYSWQVLNRKIALKEFAISGAEFNTAIRDNKKFSFLMGVLFGNKALYRDMTENFEDVVVAHTVPELAHKMNALGNPVDVEADAMEADIRAYDAEISRGAPWRDEQLQKLAHLREYRGDRLRTCKFQKILDPKAAPLIAIREFIISRKSLGGIETDLESRVLAENGSPIANLFAVGEAAGFGGGGMHGLRALEGTFLGGCILTARAAAKAIVKGS